ncbi:bifunctional folylpolyglutamate synthase/dihydrofolate synthase [Myxococcota bacterium]|nr:bifunctional folylpolyglutamate synthase/dihydrofolate synthase [Myxococcota bacterium]
MGSVDVITTAAQAGVWLEGLINHEKSGSFRSARLDLAPIEDLMARLGHPQRELSILHVAGSKGKGSVCLLAESMLGAMGERVGTFTSPHLERWTERFRVGGQEVEPDELAVAAEIVRPHVESMRATPTGPIPTFFDATTAIALVLFARHRVDRAVIEVGLGGRLDSTNVVAPAVTVVTQIELEHTDKLGSRLEDIAFEKAGIIKPTIPCVTGSLVEPAQRVVDARAQEVGAPIARLGRDFFLKRTVGDAGSDCQFDFVEGEESIAGLELPLLGQHQFDNAALAIAAIRRLRGLQGTREKAGVREGLSRAELPGRLEILCEHPRVIVDAAHTEASARSLAEVLASQGADRRGLVLSISRDKSVTAILKILAPVTDEIWLTRADATRSSDLDVLKGWVDQVMPGVPQHAIESAEEATRTAFASMRPGDLLCCAGSVYLAGAARKTLRALTSTRSPSRRS